MCGGCENNKSKISHLFFTKATDLKSIFFQMTLKIECKNMCQTFKIFKKMFFFTFLTFFDIFSTLLSTQTIKVIKIIFFNELAFRIWAMHMHFNLIPILLCLFLGGGGCGMHPPSLYIDSDPPAFTGLSGNFQDDHVMHRFLKINFFC